MKPLRKPILGALSTNACRTNQVIGSFPVLLIVLVFCIFTLFSPGTSVAQITYIGNTLTNSGAGDTDPPLVILGEYSPATPSSNSTVPLPAGVVEDVKFYSGTYGFTLYSLAWVTNGPYGGQTFQVVASEYFTNTVAVPGLHTNAVTNLMVNAGDLLAFQGTGPYYVASTNGLDATYESLGFGNPYTATNPGSAGATFSVGTNGDAGTGYEYIPTGLTLPSRTYAIGADVLSTNGYSFIILAGQGGHNGSTDGLGTNALFNDAEGTAVASNIDIFMADTANNRIRKVTSVVTNWLVTTIAGSNGVGSGDGIGTNAQFSGPQGIAVTPNETVVVADTANETIRMLTQTNNNNWIVSTIAGVVGSAGTNDGTNYPGGFAKFNNPEGIAVDINTNVFVADTANDTIRKVSLVNGTGFWGVTTIAGIPQFPGNADGSNGVSEFRSPEGIAVDAADNLYVADSGNNEIRKITPVGNGWVVTTIAGAGPTNSGSSDGNGKNAQFDSPGGITVDARDNLFVNDTSNDTVRAVVPFGTNWFVNTIGGLAKTPGYTNGTGSAARFTNPRGISVSGLGDLFLDEDVVVGGISPLSGGASSDAYNVQVVLGPQSANNAGAEWQIAGQGSNWAPGKYPGLDQTTNNLPIVLLFNNLPGWAAPNGTVSGTTNIQSDTKLTVMLSLSYTPACRLIFKTDYPTNLSITGPVGTTYYIQYITNLLSDAWSNINPNPWTFGPLSAGTNFITNLPPPVPSGHPPVYYRAQFSGQ